MSSPEDVSKMGSPADARAWSTAAVSGLGGFIVITLLALLTADFHTLLLIAPFGASCVLVFALPQSPLAQPRNVIGGHRLEKHRRQMHLITDHGNVGKSLQELEELGRLHDGVGD